MLHLAWAGFELTTLVVIGTDCIGSCKSNYHAITTTTVPAMKDYCIQNKTRNKNVFRFCLQFEFLLINDRDWRGHDFYGSWIYNYLCNQCLSPLKLWIQTHSWWGILYTTLCDKVFQWLVAGLWFSPGTLDSSTNKTDSQDITDILLKVVLNIMNHKPQTLLMIIYF
jgi:hypothetical protein